MSGTRIAVDVLLATAVVVVVLSAFGAVVLRTTFGKLHYLAPVTTIAGPLFGIALVLDTGWGITAALDLLIVGLLALSGPILQMATARVEAEQQGLLRREEPQ